MAVLLACSAFCSGSETAFFNLSKKHIKAMRSSKHRLQTLAASLIDQPKKLLMSLLLGNMMVNVLYFSVASIFSINISKEFNPAAGAAAASISFFALLLFGEIMPKSIAFSNSPQIAVFAAGIAYMLIKILSPVLTFSETFIVTPAVRLILGQPEITKKPEKISINQLKLLIESSQKQGLISSDENQLLTGILEMGFLKVRHLARPRVDITFISKDTPPQDAVKIMSQQKLTKIPVYDERIDNIIGLVFLRDILTSPQKPIKDLLKPVTFVPEQKTIESLVEFFQKNQTDIAVAVDEYGGISGCVFLDDIIDSLLTGEQFEITDPVQQIGPLTYRLAGNLSIHDWADAFGIEPDQLRVATVGGLVTSMLGKIPKPGDKARLKNLLFTVEKVKKHRIESVILTLEPNKSNDKPDNTNQHQEKTK